MTGPLSWFALLTKSNFERTVYNSILKKKIPAFLPQTRRKSIRKDRNLMVEYPLFPGYIFVQSTFHAADQLNILKTTGAVRLLGNQTSPVAVPDFQIESLKILTGSNMDLVTGLNISMKKGDPVMIIEGPLAGIRGDFIRYKGKSRVIIKIDLLGQYAGTEIEEDKIEKLPELRA
ncbi:MAG: transcriptional antiterminator [Desulfobacterales bacterium RIFOXYA12_FULL_46_15]|nr:MAG: transcriptional antiterminator [Desulfobacula sp. GWF2_41_7]OGR22031.1 MAG: transcriptional antiterminator [Desulfobacterales bacterium RIFOXYA12_FULL_46_15]